MASLGQTLLFTVCTSSERQTQPGPEATSYIQQQTHGTVISRSSWFAPSLELNHRAGGGGPGLRKALATDFAPLQFWETTCKAYPALLLVLTAARRAARHPLLPGAGQLHRPSRSSLCSLTLSIPGHGDPSQQIQTPTLPAFPRRNGAGLPPSHKKKKNPTGHNCIERCNPSSVKPN